MSNDPRQPKPTELQQELAARERDGVNAMHPTFVLDLQLAAIDRLLRELEKVKP